MRTNYLENGFLLLLMALAIAGGLWIAWPFIPALMIAALITSAVHPAFEWLSRRWGPKWSAATITGAVVVGIILPISYILVASAYKARALSDKASDNLGWFDLALLKERLFEWIGLLPLPDEIRQWLGNSILGFLPSLAKGLQTGLVHAFGLILDHAVGFSLSVTIISFALFFFLQDGPGWLRRLKDISPLRNRYDYILMERFAALSVILVGSTLIVALVQGAVMSLITLFMGLPWFYLGMTVVVTSFIPLVGAAIVWVPVTLLLLIQGKVISAGVLAVTGVVIMGFLVDNLLRPQVLRLLAKLHPAARQSELQALNHLLISTLSIAGGIIVMGVLGLIFGPLIVALSFTIFEVFEEHFDTDLDKE
jgi:predicted PurR-regulated permease PerM